MKRKLNKIVTLLLAVSFCTSFVACNKSESEFYNYENKVQQFNGSTLAYLTSKPESFSSLITVLERFPDLKEALSTQQVTLFAPVNENFDAALKYLNNTRKARNPALPVITLQNADAEGLEIMLSKYIVVGKLTSASFTSAIDGVQVKTMKYDYPMQVKAITQNASGFVGGGALRLDFSDQRGSIFPERWIITSTNAINIGTSNGTINILTAVHNFGFDEFTTRLDK